MRHRLIIWSLLLASCGTQTNDSTTDKNVESEKTNLVGENFSDFFAKFKNDSLFQVERVKFPMTLKSWDIDQDKPTNDKLDISNWRHLDFEYMDDYAKREIDAYTQETKMYADSVKIQLRGVDNGIYIDYEFVNVDGKWFLVAEKDYSN
jgi:Domain of unknown function (DUF4348)